MQGFDLRFHDQDYSFACHTLDVADPEQVKSLCGPLLTQPPRLDVLVNGTGIVRIGATDEISFADSQACLATNGGSAFNMFQQTLAIFRQQCAVRGRNRYRRLELGARAAYRHVRLRRVKSGAAQPCPDRLA